MNKTQKRLYSELFSIKWCVTYNIMAAAWAWVIMYGFFENIFLSSLMSAVMLSTLVVYDFIWGSEEVKNIGGR